MDNIKSEFKYYALQDGQSVVKDAKIELEDYKRAASQGQSFSQYINAKFSDANPEYGTAFVQGVQSAGCATRKYTGNNGMSPTLAQIYNGQQAGPAMAAAAGNVVTAPTGHDNTPAGRIFYPEIVMDIMRDSLAEDRSDIETGFNSLVAVTENISGSLYIQPTIDVTAPEQSANQPIAQGADPATMVSISTSQSTRTIPTKSIALQITDQAMNFATIDLVATILASQGRGERSRMVDSDINAMISGDTDRGQPALSATNLQTWDPAISSAGEVTHKGFLKMLHSKYQKRSLNSAIMDIDTYLAFEGRSGRPTQDTDKGMDDRLNTSIQPMNFSLSGVNTLIVDTEVIGANRALFFDKNYALRRVIDVTAQYEAIQNFVMRRVQQMRFDYGQHVTRLYDEAFELVSLTV